MIVSSPRSRLVPGTDDDRLAGAHRAASRTGCARSCRWSTGGRSPRRGYPRAAARGACPTRGRAATAPRRAPAMPPSAPGMRGASGRRPMRTGPVTGCTGPPPIRKAGAGATASSGVPGTAGRRLRGWSGGHRRRGRPRGILSRGWARGLRRRGHGDRGDVDGHGRRRRTRDQPEQQRVRRATDERRRRASGSAPWSAAVATGLPRGIRMVSASAAEASGRRGTVTAAHSTADARRLARAWGTGRSPRRAGRAGPRRR